jgi:hypothetical protein
MGMEATSPPLGIVATATPPRTPPSEVFGRKLRAAPLACSHPQSASSTAPSARTAGAAASTASATTAIRGLIIVSSLVLERWREERAR